MGIISSNLDTEIVPTDGAKLMRPEPRQSSTQMDPSLPLSTCVDNRVGPSNMGTDVVPSTMSPMPKLEWRERCSKK